MEDPFSTTLRSLMSLPDELSSSRKNQRSLKKAAKTEGTGLFTGQKAEVKLTPAPQGTGIVFQRVDLPNKPFPKSSCQLCKRNTSLHDIGQSRL